MRKTILALATAGALAGTALPALAHDYDDDGYYRHRNYYGDSVYGRPYYYHRQYYYHRHYYGDDDYYERSSYRRWWCKHHDCGYGGYYRPYYRRYGY